MGCCRRTQAQQTRRIQNQLTPIQSTDFDTATLNLSYWMNLNLRMIGVFFISAGVFALSAVIIILLKTAGILRASWLALLPTIIILVLMAFVCFYFAGQTSANV
jgi:hypothetical protein